MDSQTSASLARITSVLARTTSDDSDLQLALELAIDLLKTGDFQSQWDVAKLLPKFGDRAIPPLLDILQDDEAEDDLLWFVARILGEFDHPVAIASLMQLLQTSSSPDLTSMAATTLGSFGKPAIAPLTELLQSETTRLIAVQAFAQISDAAIVDPLLSVLDDATPAVRAAAIEALSQFPDAQVLTVLIEALHDKSAAVRRSAVSSLGRYPDQPTEPSRVELLKPLLWDVNLDVCEQVAIALGRIGTDEAAIALFEVLQSLHTPLPLQLEAIRSLGWIGTATALNYLQQCLTLPPGLADDRQGFQAIVASLGRIDRPQLQSQAADILVSTLMSPHPAVQEPGSKQTIALSLGQLGQLHAMDCLIQLLADPNVSVRLHAIAALKQLDAQRARRQLDEMLQQDLTPDLQAGVALALQEWDK